MRLISLNVWNGGGQRIAAQVEALSAHQPDIVALQEVFATSVPRYAAAFAERGLPYPIDCFSLAPDPAVLTGRRGYGELLVSRWPLSPLPPSQFPVPWPERILSAVVQTPGGDCEVHTSYVPDGSGHDWLKIDVLEGMYSTLARHVDVPRILCGDFNLPQFETPTGEVITWGQRRTPSGKVITERHQDGRWDRGERNVMVGLAAFDLVDAFRLLNGYERDEQSWRPLRKSGDTVGYRLDHIFASSRVEPVRCVYLHEFRETTPRLSDHSAMLLDARFGVADAPDVETVTS
jgi:exonuclease III